MKIKRHQYSNEENQSNDTVEVVVVTDEIPTVSGSVEMAIKYENHKKLINETKKSFFFNEKKPRGLKSNKCLIGSSNIFNLLFKFFFFFFNFKSKLELSQKQIKRKKSIIENSFSLVN